MCSLRVSTVLLAHWVSTLLAAQYWAPADLPITVDVQLFQFYNDEEEDVFCVVGRTFICDTPGNEYCAGILRYNAGNWDTLGSFNAGIGSVAQWEDTLFIAGTQGVDGIELPGGAVLWYNDTWQIDPQLNAWSHSINLRKRDGNIYALGRFEVEPGIDHYGVGIRRGGRWAPLGNLPPPSSSSAGPQIVDIIEYNGQLVITGNINTTIGDDVLVLQGADWVPLGGGLVGWNSFGDCLAVYQGDLYVGGGMSVAAGDVGQNIIRWDGQQWHPVGSGMQTQLNNFGNYGAVRDMVVHYDELFVCGGFRYAGGIYSKNVARWNGSQWCSLSDEFLGSYAYCMGFFQDTLYVNASGDQNWQQEYGYVAKFVAPEYENNCGLWTEVEEATHTNGDLRAWVQGGELVIEGLPAGTYTVELWNFTGQLILRQPLLSYGQSAVLPLPEMAAGLYVIKAPTLFGAAKFYVPAYP